MSRTQSITPTKRKAKLFTMVVTLGLTLGMVTMSSAYAVTSAQLANTGAGLGPLPWIAGVLLLSGIILAVVKIIAARRK